ncbi:MAG: hypothetical protein LBS59_04390 [Puniceicoccales bacterium]|jgi:membrane protein implicated in regulation of membrane protease activity|nr:hypothetical protein [Puniceicoccales bacterium]
MKKLLSASFWIVMLVHIVVFTGIGLFTERGWQLLAIFLAGLTLLLVLFWGTKLYSKRHPEKRRLAALIAFFQSRGKKRENIPIKKCERKE